MPRAGRSLELLVQALEQLLAGSSVEIRSPDYIIGRYSGTRREIDVSLRSHVGSVGILVIIECRDRAASQDVSWIEQLASKRDDVAADKAVAVSASGFSAGARNLARSKQVDLRSLEKLEPDVVFGWLNDQTIDYRTRHVDATRVSCHLGELRADVDPVKLAQMVECIRALRIPEEGLRQDDKIFADKADLTLVSADDILDLMPGFGARFDAMVSGVPPSEKKRIVLTIDFAGDTKFALPTESGLCDITSIELDAHFYYEESPIPLRRYLYQAGSGTITQNAEATIVAGESRVTIGFHVTPSGSLLGLTVNSAGDSPPCGMDLSFDLGSPRGPGGQTP